MTRKNMTKKIDLHRYSEFVENITSNASNNLDAFIESTTRIDAVHHNGHKINAPLLLTSAMGMSGEAGEFSEISKKLFFHGKELTAEVHTHMQKELGDIIFYWTNACRAIGVDPDAMIQLNMDKLTARYPGGAFSSAQSDNRKSDDI